MSSGPPTRNGGDVLPLEPARLVALREYISLWERGLGHHDAFVARALDAIFTDGVTDKALYLITPFAEIREDVVRRVRAVLVAPLAPTATGARATSEATRAALAAWLLLTCLVLVGCRSPYEGLWQTTDRRVTLSLDADHTARWNVYLGPDPDAHGDDTQGGFFRLLQGPYETTDKGVRLTLHCASGATNDQTCVDPKSDVACVRDGDTLTCAFDDQATVLTRADD